MKLIPILFSTPMVQAILEGRKTQTRRIMKDTPVRKDFECYHRPDGNFIWVSGKVGEGVGVSEPFKYPYGKVGDVLWVKEEHYKYGIWVKDGLTNTGKPKWKFKATDTELLFNDNKPSSFYTSREAHNKAGMIESTPSWYRRLGRFMFKKDARLFLKVTNLRVELLQGISEEDAKAEGVEGLGLYPGYQISAKGKFEGLWNLINGDEAWDLNPWVWVIQFERCDKPAELTTTAQECDANEAK